MANSIYKRLTGKQRGMIGFSQLWLGPDHILLVRSSRLTEHYQRFSFSDIQSIVITGSPDRTVMQVGAVLLAIAWGALAVAMSTAFGKGFFLVTAAIFVALAVLDVVRGPRCTCTLYTSVSQERLPPVSRQRIAHRVLAVLRPAIESVQGSLSAEQLAEVPSSPEVQTAPPRLAKSGGRAAWILFGLLLLDSILVWTGFRYSVSGGTQLIATAYGAEILLGVMVLVQDRAHPLRIPYLLAILAMVCVGVDIYATVPDVWRRFALEVTSAAAGKPAGPNTVYFPDRVINFALAWRLVGGVFGLMTLFLMRPGKPKEELPTQ